MRAYDRPQHSGWLTFATAVMAIVVIALDVLVVYALAVHGGRPEEPAE